MAFKKDEKTPAEKLPRGPTQCSWNDYGDTCPHRGILSPGTNGGPWFCREHFYRLRGYKDMEDEGLHGNQLPKRPMHSAAVDVIRPLVTRTTGKPMAKFVNAAGENKDWGT